MPKLSVAILRQRRDAKVAELAQLGPLVQGSLTRSGVTCGNPHCKCARGEKHVRHQLTRKVNGKTRCVYVPVAMLEEAQAWTAEYRRAKRLLKAISDLNEQLLRTHVASQRARTRNQARAASRVAGVKSSSRNSRSPQSS